MSRPEASVWCGSLDITVLSNARHLHAAELIVEGAEVKYHPKARKTCVGQCASLCFM